MSPWKLLGRDLRAAAASTRLRLWELWRRNRQGDLPRPSFWPPPLAGLFWPLVLALGLGLVLGLGVLGVRSFDGQRTQPRPEPVPLEVPAALDPADATAVEAEPSEGAPKASELPPPSPAAAPRPSPVATPTPGTGPEPDPALTDLRQAFQDGEGGTLIRAVHPIAAAARLRLVLDRPFLSLDARRRQHLADGWLEQGRRLGYTSLMLESEGHHPLGRSARVGSGMILLAPLPADAAPLSPAAGDPGNAAA
ncbi:conserved hypothetical protein [Cyanobium sp. PCC 7001]|nr:conserved hypothetical protein [Cyanobium sp. PCC 7001]